MQKHLAPMTASELIAHLQTVPPKPRRSREYRARAKELITMRLRRKHQALVAYWREPGRREKMVALWNDGYSSSIVAFKLGGGFRPGFDKEQHPTRCAVVGQIVRLRKKGVLLRTDQPKLSLKTKSRKRRGA